MLLNDIIILVRPPVKSIKLPNLQEVKHRQIGLFIC